ncbi:MAG: putative sulfate exporter family transporter [Pseudomonadota bacterium]
MLSALQTHAARTAAWTKSEGRMLFPGVLVAVLVSLSAQFLAEHYQTPAMLLALLLGMALGFLGQDGPTVPGIQFAARTLLRLGVLLLGVRISAALLAGLPPELIALVIAGVGLTIGFGFAVAGLFGHRWRFALLTAGSVAICGASAAAAISAILPRDDRSEERLAFTVMGVTVLSTLAMIAYPIVARSLELSETDAGIFLGGTIHDVAQVVGAGFTISDEAGKTATLIKLFRVALLAPVVLVASVLIRHYMTATPGTARPPLIPGFVLGFLALATVNSIGLIPQAVVELLTEASRWMLLTAIAAVGMKTDLRDVMSVGAAAIALIVLETVFIAGLVLGGILLLD